MRKLWNFIFEEARMFLQAALLLGLAVTGLGFISVFTVSPAYAQYAPIQDVEATTEKAPSPPDRVEVDWNGIASHINLLSFIGLEPVATNPEMKKLLTEKCQSKGPGWRMLGAFGNSENEDTLLLCLSPVMLPDRPQSICSTLSKVSGKKYRVEDLDVKAGTFACTAETPGQTA